MATSWSETATVITWRENDQTTLAELLESGFMADAEIHLGARTWRVHRSIISLPGRCKYFEAVFTRSFEEGSLHSVSLDEDMFEDKDITALLTFLYTGVVHVPRPFLIEATSLVTAINLWLVADYFKVSELSKIAVRSRDMLVDCISPELARFERARKPDELSNTTPAAHVIAAIERLHELSDTGNSMVVPVFQPALLRLVLGGRHTFPLESLRGAYPDFFGDWELLLNKDELRAQNKTLYPSPYLDIWNKTCNKCKVHHKADTPGCATTVLDHIHWATFGGPVRDVQWLCKECYTAPTLEEWKLVNETYMIKKHEKEVKEDLFCQEAELVRQEEDLLCQVRELRHQKSEINKLVADATTTAKTEVASLQMVLKARLTSSPGV